MILTTAAAALIASAPAAAGPNGKSATRPDVAVPADHGSKATPGWARKIDPDMGDDNASDRAIDEVCTKGTPAAERSAICDDTPMSRG